jgi:hypothetical protein
LAARVTILVKKPGAVWMPGVPKKPAKPRTILAQDPVTLPGTLKPIGGSMSDDWNSILANQTCNSLWLRHSDEEDRDRQLGAAVAALIGIGPKDEMEGMIASQLVACHNAAMECYRRSMLPEQTFQGRQENLNQANKLSRTYALLLDSLNRHRGKGQQKVTVEHVHVHSGGQAIVGTVERPTPANSLCENQHDARQITHTPQPTLRSPNAEREPVPVTSNAKRPLPNARRKITRCSEG